MQYVSSCFLLQVVVFHQSRCQWPELSSLLGMFGLGGRGPGRGWTGGLPQLPGLRQHREGLKKARSQGTTGPRLKSHESPKSEKVPYGSLKQTAVHEDSARESPDSDLAGVLSLQNSYKFPTYNPNIDSYGSPESSVISSDGYQEKLVESGINLKESPQSQATGLYEHLEPPVPDTYLIDLHTSYKFPNQNQSPESPRVDNHDVSVIYGSTKPNLSYKVNNPSLEAYPKNPSDSSSISENIIGNYTVEFASPRYPANTEQPPEIGQSNLQNTISNYKKHRQKEMRQSNLLKSKAASTPHPVLRYPKPTKISKQPKHTRIQKKSKRPNKHDKKPPRNKESSRFSANLKVSYKFPKNELQLSYKTPKRKPTKPHQHVSSKRPKTKSSKYPRGRYQGSPRKNPPVQNYPASTVPPSKPLPYRPPPLIEPAILGFHPLAPVVRPGHTQDNGRNAAHLDTVPPPRIRQPTYPPEEFIW